MNEHNGQTAAAQDAADNGDHVCEIENTCTHARETEASVSPAISPAISPNGSRITNNRDHGNKSGDQSGSHKPNCYACKHRDGLPGDAHSQCNHPALSEADRLLTPYFMLQGIRPPAWKRLNISANKHGIEQGWFMWPMNYDPVWLDTCDGFEEREGPPTVESQ